MSKAQSGENHSRGMLNKHHSEESREKMSKAQSVEKNPRGMLNKHHSKETRKRQSESHIGKYPSEENLRKKRTPFEKIKKNFEDEGFELLTTRKEYEEYPKEKLRVRCLKGHEFFTFWYGTKAGCACPVCAAERIRLYRQLSPAYNPAGCKLIDEYGKEHNYNFQHAENGGEFHVLSYWLDGYDKEKNVGIEIDEKVHFDKDGNLKEKDVQRQKEITDFLGCKFIRLRI